MSSIAVIPARSGSKRIPRKNVKTIAGLPAIAYPIRLAIDSGIFERVIVTTDDKSIADISISLGAEVPFIRSSILSNDFAGTVDVVSDVASFLIKNKEKVDYICCIYPVTPLLRVHRLQEAFELVVNGNWDFVLPAIEFTTPIERGFKKTIFGSIELVNPEYMSTRTQDISKTFHDAGQFYFGKTEAWIHKKPILGGNSTFLELSKYEVLDVDDIEDWAFLEQIIEFNKDKDIGD